MKSLETWAPCLADPDKGIAFFDLRPASEETLRIEADPITEPRWDRVLPILEEEQVFMCRMMAPLLQSGENLRVLDVGTGSGVFAICAAKLGCRVTAIDISPRALRFARHNADLNGVRLSMGDQEPRPSEIRFRRVDMLAWEGAGEFDVVILAPPYNPTCPGVLPALHASAGELGQDCFLEQLPVAAKLLCSGGICIGNQMILADDSGKLLWEQSLKEAFPQGTAVFKRIIKDDQCVDAFLGSQYSTYLDVNQELCPSISDVTTYIERQPDNHKFALIYFEITKKADASEAAVGNAVEIKEVTDGVVPPQDWKDRELLHRRIIEHTSHEHSFPAPALFLEVDALPDFPEKAATEPVGSWRDSCLSYVDSWFAKTRLLHPETGLFNLVLVDTAPWYPSRAKRSSLPQECAMWVNNASSPESDEGSSRNSLKAALLEYQKNTIRQQRLRVGPFLHPVFTGSQMPCEWRPIHFSTFGAEGNETPIENTPSWRRAVGIAQDVANYELTREEEQRLESTGNRVVVEASKANYVKLTHVSSNLEQLEVPAGDIASVNDGLAVRIESISTTGTQAEKALTDFNDCHLSMHLRLREVFNSVSDHSSERVTHLVGIPVSIASTDSSHEIRTLPESYRGGVWVYVEASSWSPKHERYLLDLTRVLSMLYEDQYTKMSSAELRLISADASRFNWSHETKHLIVALRRWPSRMTGYSASLPFGIGNAEKTITEDLAILPFASLFDAGMAHLQAWTMAASASDLPFCGEDSSVRPNDFTSLADAAFKAAQDAFLIRLFRNFSVEEDSFAEMDRFLSEIRNAMPSLVIEGVSLNTITVDLEKRFWQDLARLLLCEFREMLQHSLWADGCSVALTHSDRIIQSMKFRNAKSGDKWKDNLQKLRLPEIRNFFLDDVYLAFKEPLFSSPHSLGDGDRERTNLAETLGAIINFPTDSPVYFSVEYLFQQQDK